MKLVQKQLLKSIREFEMTDTLVSFRFRTLLKENKLTVELAMINPEPVVNGALLEFHSRVKCDPLLTLLIDKPNAAEFNAFVDELKLRARQQYHAFAGLREGSLPPGMAANVFEEPPQFDEPGQNKKGRTRKPVSAASIDSAIQMLQQYLQAEEIQPLLTALQALRAEPENEAHFRQLVTAFDDLGPRQGAVLTYAPYISILLSDDPFEY